MCEWLLQGNYNWAAEGWVGQPSLSVVMAPQLYALFAHSLAAERRQRHRSGAEDACQVRLICCV